MIPLLQILAQSAPATPATQPSSSAPPLIQFLNSGMFPLLLILVVVYIFMFGSKKKEDRKRTDMLGLLKKGDEVQTIGGIIGKVIEAREDRVQVKVDEGSNTKIWFSRNAIHRVLTQDKVEAK